MSVSDFLFSQNPLLRYSTNLTIFRQLLEDTVAT